MPSYRIPGHWQMYGDLIITADSLEEAIREAYDGPLPDRQEYLDNTYEVDMVGLKEWCDNDELTEADQAYLDKQYQAEAATYKKTE